MADNPKILVADDEPGFTVVLQYTLAVKGYRVVIVSNRVQAEDMVPSEKPDLVILGTMAPRGDAFLFYRWLKGNAQFCDLPIIVLDAPLEKQLIKGWSKDEGLQLEAEDYLVKPIEPASLVPRIEKLLDKTTRRIKVLVVDDHAIVREGIRALLALQKDIQVVGEAVNGEDAVEKARRLSPDVVLMDLVMPGVNGLEATKRICEECGQAKVLMLSQYDDEENVLASGRVGALEFIPKGSAGSQLVAAIRSAGHGRVGPEPLAAP